ncbi:formyltetrahydrofolate deformylase [Sinobacterium caligoides]|uniref:Formyltetrahydrofolate deformylase n=1 Tax=Sinobacterium caligoides TaxID=933926 RepID=A0A3N2DYW2_9GAMM|nr:formyltetrahydrofolate deformylase [Sinobacterium caligoides]ROS04872.1 formyltetrahydrofolate deformylase [Sinobacterium caligoides]
MDRTFRLIISCPDKVGIVAAVSQFVADRDGWMTEANYHADRDTGQFFMHSEILADSLNVSYDEFYTQFAELADRFDMQWRCNDSDVRKKVVLMASHASHCLADILHRWESGELNCDIVAVIANHENLRAMVEWHKIPYHYIDFKGQEKAVANAQVEQQLSTLDPDVIVLARYMQIVPQALCQKYSGKIINIHHSFLPSFIGANPYQKAFDRGVKLVGATCHYVTEQLDEGPILDQDVIRVSHRDSKDDMVRLGKDVERRVLARGLRAHLEDRAMIQGNKTVIFD